MTTRMAAYLDGKEPDEATLKRLIRKAVITGAFYPGAVRLGVQEQGRAAAARRGGRLSAVAARRAADQGHRPTRATRVVRKPNDNEPLALLAFKIMDDPFVGTITFCRIYSGTLDERHRRHQLDRERKERIGRMLLMHANNREDIKEAYAGDIVALAGLKEARTGDTLCDPKKPVILEKMEFPDPVIEIAIEPKSKADQEKLGVALAKLAAEDPSFRVSTDQESGQTILKGMGELHLDIKVDILQAHLQGRRQYRRAAGGLSREDHAGGRQSTTRTRSRPAAPASSRASRSSSSRLPPGSGFEFENEIVGGAVPKEYIPGVEKGLESVLGAGVLAGFPVVDLKVHADRRRAITTSTRRRSPSKSPRAPRLREALQKGGSVLLEPIMKVEVRDAGGLHRLRHRRSQFAARPDPGPGHARQRQRHQRDGAARQHVRLRQQPALDVAGPRHLHDAIRSLRASARERVGQKCRRNSPDPLHTTTEGL